MNYGPPQQNSLAIIKNRYHGHFKVHTTMSRSKVLLLMGVIYFALQNHANAQMEINPNTGTLVATFLQSCVEYAGNPTGLTAWTHKNSLPELPTNAVQAFMAPNETGIGWNASIPDHKRVLIYQNDGTCHLIAQADEPLAAQEALLTALQDDGVDVSTPPSSTSPDGLTTTRLYEANIGTRSWQLAIISKIQVDNTNGLPTVDMIAQDTSSLHKPSA
jgi:hypothetical protein